jgi:hypothetical protein
MKQILKDFQKRFGYIPTDEEILSLYCSGQLYLSDKQENEIIKYFNL